MLLLTLVQCLAATTTTTTPNAVLAHVSRPKIQLTRYKSDKDFQATGRIHKCKDLSEQKKHVNMKTATTLSPSPPLSHPRNIINTSEAPATPAIIPLDYNYQIMAPSSALSRYAFHQPPHSGNTARTLQLEAVDTQYSSLFGDPVPPPPPEEFFASGIRDAVVYSRRPSMVQLSSEEEEGFTGRHSTTRRLFPEIPYSSAMTHRPSNALYAPRLQPPDIQILPNSSGGSSSDPRDSPNYALLAPDDILRHPSLYEVSEPADTPELKETMTISDASGLREYSEATQRVSNFSEDFKSNVGSLGSPPPDVPELPSMYTRQYSNESYSSSEWFRPSPHGLSMGITKYPEFSKMPCLRPSSKNVMSIKRDEMPMHHSPVAAMINDSNESSSGEERLLDTTVVLKRATVPLPSAETPLPTRPTDPSATYRCDVDSGLLLSPQQFLQQLRRTSIDIIGPNFPLPSPPPSTSPPPPIPPAPAPEDPTNMDEHEVQTQTQTINREVSPAIIRDAVATGGDFRVDQARLHKKTSFTIISDKSPTPQSSRAQSPAVQHHKSQISPFLGHGFKDIASATPTKSATKSSSSKSLQRRSLSSTQLKLPQLKQNFLTSTDYPRPLVQFNMTERRSPSKTSHKGILQHRASGSSSQDHNSPLPPNLHHPPKAVPSPAVPFGSKMKSCETLPLITDPYRTAIPRLNRSSLDLRCESPVIPPGSVPRPLRPNPNPTRKQRGLLRVINSADSLSRIPLRSNWASMDDMSIVRSRRKSSLSPLTQLKGRRRSSSTSPERRSSTQTASDRRSSNLSSVTASDFSFRRPPLTPQHQQEQQLRRKSLIPRSGPNTPRRRSIAPELNVMKGNRTPRNRIVKPTTLSPIIGTPNKESSTSESPAAAASFTPSEIASDSSARRGSLSKIPILNGDSKSNSRLSSRNGSRRESRSSSPTKDFTGVPISLSGFTSRAASSRSPSRATTRTESRASSRVTSKGPSRSTSRASTRPISQEPSRPSSRMEQARSVANSRSNSRLSQNSVARTSSVSPAMGKSSRASPLSQRQSISLSPKTNRHTMLGRRTSLSPDQKKRTRVSRKSPEKRRRSSRSRIPTRAKSGVEPSKATKSPPKTKKLPLNSGIRRSSPTRKSSQRSKETAGAKKAPTSVQKTSSSVKRTPSSVKKPPTAAKKQPSSLQRTLGGNSSKREASNVQKKSSAAPGARAAATTATFAGNAVKQEASSLRLKKGSSAAEIKRLSSGIGTLAAAAKVTAHKKATVAAVKGTIAAETSAGPVMGNGSGTVTGTDSGSAASTASLQRQSTKLRLIRAGSKLSLLSGKRSDSNLSKKFDAETTSIAEETDSGAQPDGSQPGISASASENVSGFPAAILEKSQKTLENVQKTVTEATDEIQKTINDNLTDLKNLESDMSRGGGYDSAASPTSSVATVVENKSGDKGAALSVSRTGTAEGAKVKPKGGGTLNRLPAKEAQKSPAAPTQPIEAAVSVINGVATSAVLTANASGQHLAAGEGGDLAERNYELGIDDKTGSGVDGIAEAHAGGTNGSADEFKVDAKRRSPDGQGGSTAGSGDKTSTQDYLEEKQGAGHASRGGCCRCCTSLCMPCRRSRCSRCCSRKKSPSSASISNNNNNDEAEQPVLASLEVVNEKKASCWSNLNCCKRKAKDSKAEEPMAQTQIQTIQEESPDVVHQTAAGKQSNKCGLCMSKVFCCRSVNKVKTSTSGAAARPGDDEGDVRRCCFCIPCGRRRGAPAPTAWQDPEVPPIVSTDSSVLDGMDAAPEPKQGCLKRLCNRLLCCRKKPPPVTGTDSRRASMKQAAPPEETRRKLHVDLVEYNSKMKGAIPVLPLYLAWFCVICNTVFPGLGTLFSGIFCVCVGIPRFSHYDSAKGRLGSLIINTIVGFAQFFCVLFCFVGWGWSIWWGTIMLKCAKKLSKIKKVERLEMEEEQRQLEQAAAAAAATSAPPASDTKASKK